MNARLGPDLVDTRTGLSSSIARSSSRRSLHVSASLPYPARLPAIGMKEKARTCARQRRRFVCASRAWAASTARPSPRAPASSASLTGRRPDPRGRRGLHPRLGDGRAPRRHLHPRRRLGRGAVRPRALTHRGRLRRRVSPSLITGLSERPVVSARKVRRAKREDAEKRSAKRARDNPMPVTLITVPQEFSITLSLAPVGHPV